MQPLAIDLALLRDVLLPEVRIAPGRALAARVVTAENGRGSLSIAGYLIEAELPRHVRAGQDLRLEVRDVNAERVLLAIADPRTGGPAPAPMEVPLPGGGTLTVTERDAGAGGHRDQAGAPREAGAHSLGLRYDAPSIGAVDLRFDLDPGSLRVNVTVAAGTTHDRAHAEADALRQALASAVAGAISVTVTPRRDPIDVYA